MRKIIRRKTIKRRTIRTISDGDIFRPYVNKRKRLILGEGNISQPYVNKRKRLILGEGKRIKKQRGGFIAPIAAALAPAAIELVSKLFR